MFPEYQLCWELLLWTNVGFCQKCFLCIYWDDNVIFILCFVNVIIIKFFIYWSKSTCFKLTLIWVQAHSKRFIFFTTPTTFCFWCHTSYFHVNSSTVYCSYSWFLQFLSFNFHANLFKCLSHCHNHIFAFTSGIFPFLYFLIFHL